MPNQYASYDAMGNMTCRNVDTTSGHGCDAAQSGAIMTYDNEGRLATWVAPNGTVASDQFLYDNSGQRVLQRASNTVGSTTTTSDTISFDGFTDVTITGGTTSTTKYYSAGGQKVAMRQDGTFSYLMPDFLGSNSIALRSDGSVQAVQLFSPFGATRYSDGTMLSPFNFTGQRLDTQTGLLYYNARYYDASSGRFTSADTVETNASGLDPFAYVKGNPETFADPTGHGRCNTDGDCTYGSGPPPAPTGDTGTYSGTTPPGVGGDDACHNMALCGPGGSDGLGGGSPTTGEDSQPTPGGSTQCHGGCNAETLPTRTDSSSNLQNTCDKGCQARKALLALWDKRDKQAALAIDVFQVGMDVAAAFLEATLPSPVGGLGVILQLLGSLLPHLVHLGIDLFAYKYGNVPIWMEQMQVLADQFAVAANIVNAGLGLISLGLLDFAEGGVAALKLMVQKSLAPMVGSLLTAAMSGSTESTDERQLLRLQMGQNNDAWAIQECHAEGAC
ncbi:RHS repeat-associated core domain-containing protein [Dictyobacter kobayashii]|uniref:Teneurin-like YD-shell domain-containing protein n=1 Tax=Dictyobacter kobayashii TaxID=2014872 RepID=A0A402AVJ6_9CHLR|nr:RHS repeat-associated core domain-containing protein [Dictyobacter kobayashii]GCE23170.1 hypothetical protein KDK_69700 [Dictyobacter kobayashii]